MILPKERPTAIIFDWDNTLIDSWTTIHQALSATFTAYDLTPWALDETRVRVQKSMRDSFPALFGDRWEEAGEYFYEQYDAIHIKTLTPLADVETTLGGLVEQGIYLAVVSNKKGHYLRKEATHLGWNKFFGQIVGALDADQDKPAVEPVTMALNGSGIETGTHVWFAGDSNIDMECAKNASCVPVLVREKEPEPFEFKDHPPSVHVSGCLALSKLIDTL
ncbi:MAG: HAD family hydrolase [Rhodospirillaceae bacterium]|nr:HAD family hydrolase [Rhodospirillales bacterium]MBT3905416.1 HAD family hydrolase [Rhodospirillaceae bacterium]MBT4702035.1 HAD family hydrolase [Rhodospirillaceae bacterium]MBT5033952.1 HAD family hydrolase [Rhodospirillaceae bacterium]MBT6222095.1 HAD family hydrolase [Rhodospirillaceae bacterium]